jgi:dienelactone hydrolase
MTDALDGFEKTTFTSGGKTRDVYRAGSGPAVIVISEMPGITPHVAGFARRVADLGCTAVMPHLFGVPGRAPSPLYSMESLAWGCVSREFATWATGQTSPITEWLRALAKDAHQRCGGPGVGVVGMCFTGGFALAMMVDDVVVAPVLSQPSLPFPITKKHRRDLGISDADLAAVKKRAADGVCVMGLRFTGDRLVPGDRFRRLREELGDNFIGVEIDSSPGNADGYPKVAHSVLTENLIDREGSQTRKALEDVLEFFRSRLGVSAAG